MHRFIYGIYETYQLIQRLSSFNRLVIQMEKDTVRFHVSMNYGFRMKVARKKSEYQTRAEKHLAINLPNKSRKAFSNQSPSYVAPLALPWRHPCLEDGHSCIARTA